MAAKRKGDDALDSGASTGRLGQLLETETELDAMLGETKREAERRIAVAQEEAQTRKRRFEMEFDAADRILRGEVAADRDETIAGIRAQAMQEIRELERIEKEKLEELARFVVERVVGAAPGGGR